MASRNLEDCDPRLIEAWRAVVTGYLGSQPDRTLILTCTHRSVEEQFALYRKGRMFVDGRWVRDDDPATQIVTQLDGVTRKSNHNVLPARALDFAVLISGKVSWDPAEYEPVGVLGEAQGLVWGGRWKMRDYPHLELPPG